MIDSIEALQSGRYIRDLTWLPPTDSVGIERGQRMIGDTFATANFCQEAYRRWGAQVRVQAEVSTDMLQTDLGNTTMDEIIWPAKAVEMIFEDERLPGMVLAKLTVKEIKSMYPGLEIVENPLQPGKWYKEQRVVLCMESTKGELLALNLVESIWDGVLFKDERYDMLDAVPLDDEENGVLKEALRLCIKVFAYASLPRYKPVPVTQITRKMGGKPGFKGRPSRPSLRVVYLPTVHTVLPENEQDHEATGKGKSHAFKGRRGFFRTYRHERYVNMRGKRIFVAPVSVEIEKIEKRQTFIVRKT